MNYVVECVECGRRFDDCEAYDLHIQSTPHRRDVMAVSFDYFGTMVVSVKQRWDEP